MILETKEILNEIKQTVQEIIPDAKVYLFGSRVTGKVHEESDWDILAITSLKVSSELKDNIREKLSALTNQDYFFIDLKIVNEKDWYESPSYYVLRHSIKDEVVEI
jgi:predicted nucleotidyltransferase